MTMSGMQLICLRIIINPAVKHRYFLLNFRARLLSYQTGPQVVFIPTLAEISGFIDPPRSSRTNV
jgi:hypothetical protein